MTLKGLLYAVSISLVMWIMICIIAWLAKNHTLSFSIAAGIVAITAVLVYKIESSIRGK